MLSQSTVKIVLSMSWSLWHVFISAPSLLRSIQTTLVVIYIKIFISIQILSNLLFLGELNHVVNLSKPKVAFCSSSTLKLMIKLKQQHAFMEHLILFGKKPSNNLPMYEDIIRGVTKDTCIDDFEPVDLDAKEHVATILCSSGTTGMPKGVMATHRNMTAFMEIARTRVQELYEFEENMSAQGIVTFGLTPFFHSMGFMTMYMNCLGGNLIK